MRLMRSCQVRVTSALVEFHVFYEATSIVVFLGGSLSFGRRSAATVMHDLAVGCDREFTDDRALVLRGIMQWLPVMQPIDKLGVIHELLLHREAGAIVHSAVCVG